MLTVEEEKRINLTFLHFNVRYQSTCNWDWLEIEGEKYCGEKINSFTIITRTNTVNMKFITDNGREYYGFLAVWSSTAEPPTGWLLPYIL